MAVSLGNITDKLIAKYKMTGKVNMLMTVYNLAACSCRVLSSMVDWDL